VVGDGTWLTVGEAVARLEGLASDQTVRRWCEDRTLESIRLGVSPSGHRRIKASSVDALLRKLKGNQASPEASPDVE
jgi:excisionase family DNA binding protein